MSNHLFDTLIAPHAGNDRPFLIREGKPDISFADFVRLSGQYANALVVLGLTTGDRLVMQVEKSVEALAVYAAAVRAGIVFLPLNTGYTPTEVDYFVRDSAAGLLISDDEKGPGLQALADELGLHMVSLNPDGSGSLAALAAKQGTAFETVARGPEDLAALLYTSGTTGRSKGAMLSHKNLVSNAEILTDYWRFTADDVLLHALPIFHTHGLFVASNICLKAGAAMIFLAKFEPDAMIRLLPKATNLMGVPTFYTRLLADARFTRELVGHMRLFVSGSAPLLAETHAEFSSRTGHAILERYGMTETNMNTSNPYVGERRPGTVGFPLPGVSLRITDPDSGKVLPHGEIGMIEVKGDNVFQGYWQMPEKTAEEFRTDGFFITGDLARIDENGYVHILGRDKDLIITGGLNVYPKEIELLIDEQEGVLESAVIGVPHADFGEAVVAVVVPRARGTVDPETLMAAIEGKLSRFKQPKHIYVLDELPRNTMGKVQKNQLRSRYGDTFKA